MATVRLRQGGLGPVAAVAAGGWAGEWRGGGRGAGGGGGGGSRGGGGPFQRRFSALAGAGLSLGQRASGVGTSVPGSAQSGRCYRSGLFAIGCAQSVMLRRDPDSREFKMRLDLRFRAGMRS